jgi:hypothetical protein
MSDVVTTDIISTEQIKDEFVVITWEDKFRVYKEMPSSIKYQIQQQYDKFCLSEFPEFDKLDVPKKFQPVIKLRIHYTKQLEYVCTGHKPMSIKSNYYYKGKNNISLLHCFEHVTLAKKQGLKHKRGYKKIPHIIKFYYFKKPIISYLLQKFPIRSANHTLGLFFMELTKKEKGKNFDEYIDDWASKILSESCEEALTKLQS